MTDRASIRAFAINPSQVALSQSGDKDGRILPMVQILALSAGVCVVGREALQVLQESIQFALNERPQ